MDEPARQALRRRARAARQAHVAGLAAPVRRALEAALADRVRPLLAGADMVASYAATADEVDPRPLEAGLASLCFPRVADSGGLGFHACRREELAPGAFGIAEPPESAPLATPSILLVPLLLFDRNGGRLGQGGGHYDRALRSLRAAGSVRAIGLAWDMQEAEALAMAPWDERLDLVATPTRLIRCRVRAGAAA